MFILAVGTLGILLYTTLILIRYRTNWDMKEAGFSKVLHHMLIGFFWVMFALVVFDILFPSFEPERILSGESKSPTHIVILDNNISSEAQVVFIAGDTLGNWQTIYPEHMSLVPGIMSIMPGKREVVYLPADSAVNKIVIKYINHEKISTDTTGYQVAFHPYPYRKHYIFISELASTTNPRIYPNLAGEWGIVLIGVSGLLSTFYHSFRKRKSIMKTSGMISLFLLVALYSGYLLANILPLIWHLSLE